MKKRLSTVLAISLFWLWGFIHPVYAQGKDELYLETIGSLSAQGILITYLAVGVLGDGYEKNVYEKEFLLTLLTQIINVTEAIKKQMNKLQSSGMAPGESNIKYLYELSETYDLLMEQSLAFKSYVTTGNPEHVTVFHEKRTAAWKKIANLLDIK